MSDRLKVQTEVLQKTLDLLTRVQDIRRICDINQIPIPDPLNRLFDDHQPVQQPKIRLDPPPRPAKPPEAGEGWVWIPANDADPQILVMAILQGRSQPIPVKELIEMVMAIRSDTNKGSIANLGTRWDGKIIERSKQGWTLKDKRNAPILFKGHVWAPKEELGKSELAAHRRIGIVHVLKMYETGLQNTQIVDFLEDASWLQAPISKDLVKMDLMILKEQGRVKKSGNTKKWRVSLEEGGD